MNSHDILYKNTIFSDNISYCYPIFVSWSIIVKKLPNFRLFLCFHDNLINKIIVIERNISETNLKPVLNETRSTHEKYLRWRTSRYLQYVFRPLQIPAIFQYLKHFWYELFQLCACFHQSWQISVPPWVFAVLGTVKVAVAKSSEYGVVFIHKIMNKYCFATNPSVFFILIHTWSQDYYGP